MDICRFQNDQHTLEDLVMAMQGILNHEEFEISYKTVESLSNWITTKTDVQYQILHKGSLLIHTKEKFYSITEGDYICLRKNEQYRYLSCGASEIIIFSLKQNNS